MKYFKNFIRSSFTVPYSIVALRGCPFCVRPVIFPMIICFPEGYLLR